MAQNKIRYAVVGLGWISQQALLPGFAHAANSELTALVSDDPEKLRELGDYYKVEGRYSYDDYEKCLRSGTVDAVYIGLPNTLHREYTEKAAEAGIHVLCEKPMATTEDDCRAMIAACNEARARLMIAYRLHFDEMHMGAVEALARGDYGDAKFFASSFAEPVEEGNIRLKKSLGGGPIWDIGVYCINASRYFFREEPSEVFAFPGGMGESKFREVGEAFAATLKFPSGRMAQFTCSFGTTAVSALRVVGTKGDFAMEKAYGFEGERMLFTEIGGKSGRQTYKGRDQFGPQLQYFSDCILERRKPEPSGDEGLADVRIILALLRSAETGQPVKLDAFSREARPSEAQIIKAPAAQKAKLVKVAGPSGE